MRLFRIANFVLLFCFASLTTACTGGPDELSYPPGKTLKITKQVWSYYQDYLGTLGGSMPGVFLVAMDGDVGRGARYMFCPPEFDRCSAKGGGAINETNRMCKKDQLTCVLFARDSHIVVPYEIID